MANLSNHFLQLPFKYLFDKPELVNPNLPKEVGNMSPEPGLSIETLNAQTCFMWFVKRFLFVEQTWLFLEVRRTMWSVWLMITSVQCGIVLIFCCRYCDASRITAYSISCMKLFEIVSLMKELWHIDFLYMQLLVKCLIY